MIILKKYSLTATKPIDEAQLHASLKSLAGIEQLSVQKSKVAITIDLMQCSYLRLYHQLSDTIGLCSPSWHKQLTTFIESNQRDHLCHPKGWYYYLQNLYLAH